MIGIDVDKVIKPFLAALDLINEKLDILIDEIRVSRVNNVYHVNMDSERITEHLNHTVDAYFETKSRTDKTTVK